MTDPTVLGIIADITIGVTVTLAAVWAVANSER